MRILDYGSIDRDPTKEKDHWICDHCENTFQQEDLIVVAINGIEYDLCESCYFESINGFLDEKITDVPRRIEITVF